MSRTPGRRSSLQPPGNDELLARWPVSHHVRNRAREIGGVLTLTTGCSLMADLAKSIRTLPPSRRTTSI